ncbi:MAG: tetratricopeptide repeat protein [Proteobacteria bacterium]|nr:tetratricopeptide repeat protein [Pseudomonadota bacterium]
MLNLAGSRKAPKTWLLQGCAALSLVAALSAARADDIQDASQLLRSGQQQQALERVNKILAAKPRDAQARFLKGLILTEQGNTKEAVLIFQKLTEDYPDLPEPYNNLAVIYAAQGQYDKARASLEQSIRTHPSYATAYENLGDVYSKLASQAYDKALQLDSSNSAAQNKLALVRELVGGAPRGTAAAAAAKPAAKPPVTVAAAPAETKPAPAPAPAAPAPAPAPAAAPAPEAKAAAPAPAAKPAAPAPVAEKAPEKPAPKAPVAAGGHDEVLQMVNAWTTAWSKKNVPAYLAFYAKDFKTPNGEDRGEWEHGRRTRILAPKTISVEAESPKVSMTGDKQASVTFRQRYKSDTLTANGMKTLVLVKTEGGWRIQQEKVAN